MLYCSTCCRTYFYVNSSNKNEPCYSVLLQVLELLLDFAYSSRLIINEENAESLLEAGDMLQFHDIRDAAAEFLEKNLHSSNCLGMMLLSDAHQCKRLYELSWRMCLLHYETVNRIYILCWLSAQTLICCSCSVEYSGLDSFTLKIISLYRQITKCLQL